MAAVDDALACPHIVCKFVHTRTGDPNLEVIMRRRDLLVGGIALGLAGVAAAQDPDRMQRDAERIRRETGSAPPVPNRKVRTVDLFASPEGYPNAIDATPEGLWIGEQLTVEGIGSSNDAYLV